MLIIGDTAVVKQGKHSVGVARQYRGELGKRANCQALVPLTLGCGEVPVPVALKLFLPKSWATDSKRCTVVYRSTDLHAVETKKAQIDAESLARLGRMDPALLAPIQHRKESTQAGLAVIRARDALVRSRTLLVNHVRGAVKSFGGRVPKRSTPSFAPKVRNAIPESLRPALTSLLDLIEQLGREIADYDRQIKAMAAERFPEATLLGSVHGVGPLTPLCFVLTLEDPARFPNSRAVGSYLGLHPKQPDAGQSAPALRITKKGDRMLRRLLVSCGQYILGPLACGGGHAARPPRWP